MYWYQFRRLMHTVSGDAGWVPPALVLAGIVGIFGLQGLDLLLGVPLFGQLGMDLLTLIFFVGLLKSVQIVLQSGKRLWRMGVIGCLRPRWWFEFGRMNAVLFAFSFASTIAGVGLVILGRGALPVWLETGVVVAVLMAAVSFLALLVVSSIGYFISFVQGTWRTGKAYECVHFFFVSVGGPALVGVAAGSWKPANWPEALVMGAAGIAGVCLMLFGMLSIIDSYEKYER